MLITLESNRGVIREKCEDYRKNYVLMRGLIKCKLLGEMC